MVGDIFFASDSTFPATEIPCENEVKKQTELDVPLPADNLDFHQLAMAASKNLPSDPAQATREKLREIVNYQPCTAAATKTGEETRGGIQATFWKLRMGGDWTVPVTELTRGTATATPSSSLTPAAKPPPRKSRPCLVRGTESSPSIPLSSARPAWSVAPISMPCSS